MAYQVFSERLSGVEYLIGYEGNAFASTGNVKNDLLGITSVHPMREEVVIEFLEKTGNDWAVIERLKGYMKVVTHYNEEIILKVA